VRLPIGFLLGALLGVATHVSAADYEMLTGPTTTLGRFFILLSNDCQVAYYAPLNYTIDPSMSAILSTRSPRKSITIDVAYTADLAPPTTAETRQIGDWTATIGAGCTKPPQRLQLYPWYFQTIAPAFWISDRAFPVVQSYARGDIRQILHIEIDPAQITLNSALANLKTLGMVKRIRGQSMHSVAWVSIAGDYATTAQFFNHHYTERSCTISHECHKVLGIGGCGDHENCTYTPREIQLLQSEGQKNGIIMEASVDEGVPFADFFELQERLMSRLAMSLFLETARLQNGDVTRVVLGQLTRHVSGHYYDRLSIDKVIEVPYESNLATSSLADFAEKELRRLYGKM
jgi:hypothetical protein